MAIVERISSEAEGGSDESFGKTLPNGRTVVNPRALLDAERVRKMLKAMSAYRRTMPAKNPS